MADLRTDLETVLKRVKPTSPDYPLRVYIYGCLQTWNPHKEPIMLTCKMTLNVINESAGKRTLTFSSPPVEQDVTDRPKNATTGKLELVVTDHSLFKGVELMQPGDVMEIQVG